MLAHRPFFIVRNPATGQLRKIGYASVEDGMQQVVLTNGSVEAALDHPKTVLSSEDEPTKKLSVRNGSGGVLPSSAFDDEAPSCASAVLPRRPGAVDSSKGLAARR
jgi:hypothetical protein